MKFSVLISVYKRENAQNLRNAIESISIHQTIVPSEIILVKDGILTFELEEMILFIKKKVSYLKVFGYEKNRGLGYALNYGLDKCTNDLVFRMDADDISNNERFQIQLNFLKQNPDISILGSSIEEFNYKPNDLKRIRKVPVTAIDIDKKKLIRNPFNHMTVCFKKSNILRAGGYLDMPGYEDYYLWLRVLNFSKGYNLDKPLVFARVGNDMFGRRHGIRFFINEIRFQKTIYNDGIQSFYSFIKNVIIRGIPRLFPKFILKLIYKNLLRN